MRVLECFAGAGGGILGARSIGLRVCAAIERDPFCVRVLERRFPLVPVWDDVRSFNGRAWDRVCDIVSAGFPCQPFSLAGKRHGELDARNMWPDTLRVIRDVRPRIAFLENVPGLVRSYLPRVLGDLAELGFDSEWGVLGAGDVGLPHRRKRLWIYAANPDRCGLAQLAKQHSERRARLERAQRAHALRYRMAGTLLETLAELQRMDDGVADRSHRLRAIGNGMCPLTYATAFVALEGRFLASHGV